MCQWSTETRARKSDVEKTLKVDSFSNNDRLVPERTREIRRAVTFFVPDYRGRKHVRRNTKTTMECKSRATGSLSSQKIMLIFATILFGQTHISGPCILFLQTVRQT